MNFGEPLRNLNTFKLVAGLNGPPLRFKFNIRRFLDFYFKGAVLRGFHGFFGLNVSEININITSKGRYNLDLRRKIIPQLLISFY